MHTAELTKGRRVLVVGAGVCGSIAARTLYEHGCDVTICDKGRGAGGRLSSRRTDAGRLNHGAPHFRGYHEPMMTEVSSWQRAGLVDVHIEADASLIRPRGAMNAVVKHLQRELDVQFNVRVVELVRSDGGWSARTDSGALGQYDYLVLAIPAPQMMALVEPNGALSEQIQAIDYAPAWVVMVSRDAGQVCSLENPLVGHIEQMEAGLCIHLTQAASTRYVEASPNEVIAALGLDTISPGYLSAHRWRYSQVETSISASYLSDEHGALLVCGDGFGGAGVEAALMSGQATAHALLEKLNSD